MLTTHLNKHVTSFNMQTILVGNVVKCFPGRICCGNKINHDHTTGKAVTEKGHRKSSFPSNESHLPFHLVLADLR